MLNVFGPEDLYHSKLTYEFLWKYGLCSVNLVVTCSSTLDNFKSDLNFIFEKVFHHFRQLTEILIKSIYF